MPCVGAVSNAAETSRLEASFRNWNPIRRSSPMGFILIGDYFFLEAVLVVLFAAVLVAAGFVAVFLAAGLAAAFAGALETFFAGALIAFFVALGAC